MKLHSVLVLCSVLIWCLTVKTSEGGSASDQSFYDCVGVYLKSKGKLDIEIPSSRQSSFCLFGMNIALRGMRDALETKVTQDTPDKAACIMTEFDKNEMFDFALEIGYTKRNPRISEDERKVSVDALEIIGDDKLKTVATACGVDKEKLDTIFSDK